MGLAIRITEPHQKKSHKLRFFNWITRNKANKKEHSIRGNSLKISEEEMAFFNSVTQNGNTYVPETELEQFTATQSNVLQNAGLVFPEEQIDTPYDNMKGNEQHYDSQTVSKNAAEITDAIYESIDPIYEDMDATIDSKSENLANAVFSILENAKSETERTNGLAQVIEDSVKMLSNGKKNTVMGLGLNKLFEQLVTDPNIENESPEFMEQLMFLHLLITQEKFFGESLLPKEIKRANSIARRMVQKGMDSPKLTQFFNVLAQQSSEFKMKPKEIVFHRFKRTVSKLGMNPQFTQAA